MKDTTRLERLVCAVATGAAATEHGGEGWRRHEDFTMFVVNRAKALETALEEEERGRENKPPGEWIRLGDLRPGAVFETHTGTRAVKSEYHYDAGPKAQCQCVLLASGEYAHFDQRDDTKVREIKVPR